MNSDFDAVASSRVNLSRSVMTDLRLGLARALSLVIGMAVLALLASSSHRAQAAAPDDAIERYRPYVIEGIDQALAGARDLRSKAAAHDVAGARRAWLAARAGWGTQKFSALKSFERPVVCSPASAFRRIQKKLLPS
jgi:hypothetical protein